MNWREYHPVASPAAMVAFTYLVYRVGIWVWEAIDQARIVLASGESENWDG